MTTDRRRLPAIWKTRRDGVHQRYRVNPVAEERDKRIVDAIHHALQTADYETVHALIQTPEAIDAIDRQWSNIYQHFNLRHNLERAMITIGDDAIPLVERLFHRPPSAREYIGVTPSADVAMHVIEALNLQQFRDQVYRVLLDNQALVDYYINKTVPNDWRDLTIGETALRTASQLGDTRIVPILQAMMPPRNHNATELIVECLPRVVDREHAIEQLGKLYEQFLNDAKRLLSVEKYAQARTVLKSLAQLHAEPYEEVIYKAIRRYMQTSGQDASTEIDPEMLATGYPPSAYTLLVDIVQSSTSRFENPDVIPNAIVGLGRMGNPSAIPHLLPHALRNDEFKEFYESQEHLPAYMDDYREQAFGALADLHATQHMPDDDARELLHQMVRFLREGYGKFTREDSYLPYRVVSLIQRMGDPRVLPIIERHLGDETRPSYRVALYTAYAGVGGEDAVPFLTTQFAHEPPQVQSAIVRALRRIDTPDAQRFLQTVPNNPNASTLAKLALGSRQT